MVWISSAQDAFPNLFIAPKKIKTIGTGRMRYLKVLCRMFCNGFQKLFATMLIDGGEIDYALGQEFSLLLKSLFLEIGTRVLKNYSRKFILIKNEVCRMHQNTSIS